MWLFLTMKMIFTSMFHPGLQWLNGTVCRLCVCPTGPVQSMCAHTLIAPVPCSMQDVSLCSLNAHNPGTTTAPSQPSTTGNISSNSHYSHVHLTGSGASKHGDSGHIGSNTNSHTGSPSGHSYTGNHGNTTTEAAVTHQDGYPPHPPEVSDSTEMDADKEIAELLGLLGPEQPTSMHW